MKYLPSLPILLRMTRPGFLLASAVACVLGWAVAYASGLPFRGWGATWTLALAVLLHAGANVLNDVADAQNGGDAINQEAITPFTGGAGLLQSGQVSLTQTRVLAAVLFGVVLLGGLLLAWRVGAGLLLYGLVGAALAWAYSAQPLQLMRRGVGELSVAAAWVLMVAGADFVQRGVWSLAPFGLGLSYALLMANVLLINGLPDAKADTTVGKRTLVVRLGAARVPAVYAALALLAHAWALGSVGRYFQQLGVDRESGLGLWLVPQLSLLLSLGAYISLRRVRLQVRALRPAITLSIAAALAHGWLLALVLYFGAL